MNNKMRTDLSTGTFQKAATELLGKHGRFTVLTKDGVGVDVIGGKHHFAVDPDRALRTMERVGIGDFHRVYLQNDRSAVVQAVGDRIETVTRAKGDRVQAGASVIFSPLGIIQPVVQSFSRVVICSNGATMEEVEESFAFNSGGGRNNDGGFWDWFQANLRKAVDSISLQTQHFREMAEHKFAPKDRAAALEGIIREAHLPDELGEVVRHRALASPPQNAWELMNLVTWGTSHATNDYAVVRRAHKSLSRFAHNVSVHKVCPLCHSQN